MFFTNKDKKGGGSKMLTEAEIKKKLYGEYETTSADAHSSSHELKMTGTAFQTEVEKKQETSSRPAMRSPAIGSSIKQQDGIKPAVSFGDSTRRPFSPAADKNNFKPSDWKSSVLKYVSPVLGFLTGVLWKVGSYAVQALEWGLRLLDPRKPQARKLLYSITAVAMVIALFWGVFRLNVQRKKAMLGELPMTTVSAPVRQQHESKIHPLTAAVASKPAADSHQKDESQEMILKALEKNSQVKSEAKPDINNIAAPVVGAGKYVIQVATYAVLEDANRLINSMEQAGFSAFYKKQVRNSTGHSFYPVYLGRFESYGEAQTTLSKFRKASVARPFQDSFIRTLEI